MMLARAAHGRYDNPSVPKPEMKESDVQTMVCVVLKKFVEQCWGSFTGRMQQRSRKFIYGLIGHSQFHLAKVLRAAMLKMATPGLIAVRQVRTDAKPPPKLPQSAPESWELEEFSSEELARQITLVDSEMFRKIAVEELLAWNRRHASERSPNVMQLIDRSNRMSSWAATCIVCREIPEERARMVAKIVDIAVVCALARCYCYARSRRLTRPCRRASTWKSSTTAIPLLPFLLA